MKTIRMESSYIKVLKNFINLGVFQGANFLLPILVIPLLIDRVGTSGYGKVLYVQSVLTFLSIVIDYGFNVTAVKEISVATDSLKLSRIFYDIIFIKILFGCLLSAILLLTYRLLFSGYEQIVISGLIFLLSYSFQPYFFLLAKEDTSLLAITNVVNKSLFFILCYFYVLDKSSVSRILFIQGTLNIINNSGLIFYIIRKYKLNFLGFSLGDIFIGIKSNFYMFVSNISTNIIIYSNFIIAEKFVSIETLGLFGIAEKLVNALRQIVYTFYQITLPIASKAKFDLVQRTRVKKLYVYFISSITGLLVLIFIFSSKIISHFIVSSEAINIAVKYFKALLSLPLLVVLGVPFTQKLIVLGKEKHFMMVYLILSVYNISVNFLAAKYYGIWGTMAAFISTELFLLFIFYFLSKQIKYDNN